MLGKTYDNQVCSAARTLELVGERWSLLIIRDALFAGATRFNDFLALGIATNILKSRLDGLVAAGIMRREPGGSSPEYLLTRKGRELAFPIMALTEWGDRWAAPDGPPIFYKHSACGGAMSLQATCVNCGQIDDAAEIEPRPGPGLPEHLAARVTRAM
jgi:DNA-binding HxlR family transcriptional regulator